MEVSARARADGGRARRIVDVLWVLAVADLRIRYGRSGMRPLRWLLEPLAALGVYLVLIAILVDRTVEAPGLSLACAIVPFQLVMTGAINAFRAIESRGPIIANMEFPRMLIPISSVVTESIAFTASLMLLPAMIIVYGVGLSWALLWFPVVLAVTTVLTAAIAYPASLIGLWYPEFQPFAISLIRTLFFLAPGLIALDEITGTARELLPVNPLTGLFEAFRDVFLYGQSPAAWELLLPLGVAAALLALSLPLYRREQSRFAKLVG